jgi:DNA-binding transcriptional MerR regulator
MVDLTLTVSDLVDAVARADTRAAVAAPKGLVLRRIRHWTTAGVLPPEGDTNTGTGKRRQYSADTVYLAAVLNCLANIGLPLSALKAASRALQVVASGKPAAPIRLPKVKVKDPQARELLDRGVAGDSAEDRRNVGLRYRELWNAAINGSDSVYLSLTIVEGRGEMNALARLDGGTSLASSVQKFADSIPEAQTVIGLTTLFRRIRP